MVVYYVTCAFCDLWLEFFNLDFGLLHTDFTQVDLPRNQGRGLSPYHFTSVNRPQELFNSKPRSFLVF